MQYERDNSYELIQVCYNPDDFLTRQREIKALLKASVDLKCNNLNIITWDVKGKEKHNGKNIVFIPLREWLT